MSTPEAQVEAQADLWSSVARDTGMASALHSASEWATRARATIEFLCSMRVEFTADDLTRRLGTPPSAGVTGAVLRAAQARGQIVLVGYRASGRISRHKGRVAIWRHS